MGPPAAGKGARRSERLEEVHGSLLGDELSTIEIDNCAPGNPPPCPDLFAFWAQNFRGRRETTIIHAVGGIENPTLINSIIKVEVAVGRTDPQKCGISAEQDAVCKSFPPGSAA
jgi:hypothetical protein